MTTLLAIGLCVLLFRAVYLAGKDAGRAEALRKESPDEQARREQETFLRLIGQGPPLPWWKR